MTQPGKRRRRGFPRLEGWRLKRRGPPEKRQEEAADEKAETPKEAGRELLTPGLHGDSVSGIIRKVMESRPRDMETTLSRLKSYGLKEDEANLGTAAIVHAMIRAVNGNPASLKLLLDEMHRNRMLRLSYEKLSHQMAIDWARLEHRKEYDRKLYDLAYEKQHAQDINNSREAISMQLQSIADRLNQPLPERTLEDVEEADEESMEREEDEMKKKREAWQEMLKNRTLKMAGRKQAEGEGPF